MKQFLAFFAAIFTLAASATNHQVQVGSNFFNPSALTVAMGDTVTWTQVSGAHNVNGSLSTFPSNPAGFSSGSVAGGNWTYSFQFTVTGVYNYQCDPHIPSMVGTVTVTSAPCADLFFSEYLEGSSNNKALEIYNPTNAAINLSTYSVKAYNNGGTAISNSLTLPNKLLAAHDVYVIANPTAVAAILGVSDTTSTVTFFNGDDAVVLFKNTDTLDIIGDVGVDPGTNWTVGTGATSEFTLVRKATVNKGQRNWVIGATEWDVYPQNTATYLGSHSSNCPGSGGGGGGGGTTGPVVRTIGSIRGVNNDGVADSLAAVVRLRGVVSSVDFRAGGYSFHLQDATGGIVVFRSADLTNYTSPLRGDSLEVYGVLGQFNGLLQVVPDTIHLRAQNRPLPIPLVVTSLTEANEGKIVRMNGLTVSTWPTTWTGSGQNITLSDGTNSIAMRVVPLSGVWNRPQPTGTINVIGGLQQFDNSLPYTSGYQIFPRDTNDIIPVVAVNPTIRFVGSSATKLEGTVTQTVKMYVQPHLMMAGSVSLTATAGAGFVFGSDATTTPGLSGTTLTLPVPSMTDTVSFTINVLDDNLIEGPESAVFAIASASMGLSIGAPNSFTFTIADNDVFIPTYTLPQVKGVNAQFLPDSNGVMCKLQGTVLGVNTQTFATTGNVGFTIHDGSVGFGVFGAGTKNLGYTVNEGDVIRVIGVIGHFNGLAQINADSIVVISTNGALPSPVVITGMNESTESQLIRMNNVYVINSTQWTNAGSGFSVNVTNGPDTIQLRIDADVSDVYSAPCPVGTFDVVGIGGQFDNSAPHNSGYQFLPRRLADFIFPIPVTYDLAITEIMASSNDPNTLISDDWFEITNYGSSSVDLGGFSWDDNSWLPGTVVFPSMVIAPGEAIVVAQIDAANEAAFRSAWNLGPWVQVLVNEDFAIGQPGFSSSGDGVALFDTSSTPIEICRAEYSLALAGFSVEFDTACTYLGNSTVGVRGAYASTGSDVGSPGNQSIGFSENALRVGFSPNPTNGLVAIRMPSVGEYQIVLRNLNGQILASQVVNADHAEINLSGLARGMYLVDVVSEAGHAIERIVRN
jgi:plastocyanin/DNA/RNA endonuclease YhcR with UshA esterase domain